MTWCVPAFPAGAQLSDVMLLVIAIVGTTVAPWQLFFQQSYVIDKRITPRFMAYGKADLWIGIVVVVIGAVAMMAFSAVAFEGTAQFGQFSDAGAVAAGLEAHAGRAAGVMFALALLDASIIGASAVSLSTAYAIGDVLSLRHSLHRKASDARGFYAVYAGLIAIAAGLVLFGSDGLLGLLTNAVQTLAGVLLPSATVFLLLLCNDKAVLGPWVNGRWLNLFTGAVIWALVMLSVILTAATLFPDMSGETMLAVLGGGTAVGAVGFLALRPRRLAPVTDTARAGALDDAAAGDVAAAGDEPRDAGLAGGAARLSGGRGGDGGVQGGAVAVGPRTCAHTNVMAWLDRTGRRWTGQCGVLLRSGSGRVRGANSHCTTCITGSAPRCARRHPDRPGKVPNGWAPPPRSATTSRLSRGDRRLLRSRSRPGPVAPALSAASPRAL